jgi:hypothetical protein
MSLTLRDAHYLVRTQIGELEQFRWTDSFINFSLNYRAAEFYLPSGLSTFFVNVPLTSTASGGQEGVLPVQLDSIKDVKYFSGQLFPLEYIDWQEVQQGSATGSIPLYYYVKTDANQMTPMAATSDIVPTDLFPQQGGADYQQIIGVWPIIPTGGTGVVGSQQVHVWYSAYHPILVEPQSRSPIPRAFLQGWASGTIADCLSAEKMFGEAQPYQAFFDRRKEEYRIYATKHKNSNKTLKYGANTPPWRRSASSSIIIVDPTPTMGM